MNPVQCSGTNIYNLLSDVLHLPELSVHFREKVRTVVENGLRLVYEDDRDTWKVTISPVRSENETADSLLVTIQSISEKKRMNRELQREREMKTALLDTIPCSATILDEKLRLVAWNRYAQDVLYRKAEAVPQDIAAAKFFSKDEMADLRKKFRHTLLSDIEDYSEMIVHPHGGSESLCLMTRSKRVFIEGKPCVVSISIDISERKKMEEELRKSKMRFSLALEAANRRRLGMGPGNRGNRMVG
jgi:PAS domain S-box-containing protein